MVGAQTVFDLHMPRVIASILLCPTDKRTSRLTLPFVQKLPLQQSVANQIVSQYVKCECGWPYVEIGHPVYVAIEMHTMSCRSLECGNASKFDVSEAFSASTRAAPFCIVRQLVKTTAKPPVVIWGVHSGYLGCAFGLFGLCIRVI